MAIADFIRCPAGNSIEAVPTPELQPASQADRESAQAAGNSAASTPVSATAPDAPTRKPPPAASEPAGIAAAYYVEQAADRRTYFQDYQRKAVAFTATKSRVSSTREDLRTVRDMVEVAQARGWRSVELRGTETFRREAWIEAAAAGLDAAGYKASDPDRQEAERRRVEREQTRPAKDIGRAATAPSVAAVPVAGVIPSQSVAMPLPATPATPVDQRKAMRGAESQLSPDGRLILAALSEKIDRQMNRYNSDAKAELKLFVATKLQAKERNIGPVQLSAEQRRMASAPEQVRAAGKEHADRSVVPSAPAKPFREREQPRLTRSR